MPYTARSFARMVMPTLVRAGWDATKVMGYMKNKGWSYYPKLMHQDFREFQSAHWFGRKVMSYASDVKPVRSILATGEWAAPRKYKVIGLAAIRNEETGKLEYGWRSFYTNTLETKDDYSDEFMSDYNEAEQYIGFRMESFEVGYIGHKKGWPY